MVGVGAGVGVGVGIGVGVRRSVVRSSAGVGVGVLAISRTGCSVRRGAGVGVRVTGLAGTGVARYNGAVLVCSLFPNGFSNTTTINVSGTTTIASVVVRRGPPYRPIGPRTGRPSSSTQNAQRLGGGGQVSGGCQRRGGRQSGRGGAGHSGGALNCLTSILPARA
ncbi:hypothetical protein GCM10009742_01970 [Kribbella karoonensis]|uniref:Uncharacterized protein n=1 Tax=Kribbella karoonensis TaxID=324851 RepID=A0ABN2CU86_9ACTN